ncbi:hypothetical protein Misp06_04260 [Microbulbifer sp. NBRC 101763]|uniref:pilus assembly protein n=1 Tax=Microbulbifer sp. NBRC 101763 TaxID=1113820 RepID=UPI00309CCB2A
MEKSFEDFAVKIKNQKKQYFPLRSLSAAFFMILATHSSAAPGELSDVPLYSRGSAEPNIMFVLDSSGSMEEMVLPADGYSASNPSSFNCNNPVSTEYTYRHSNGSYSTRHYDEVEYRVNVSSGNVQFRLVERYNGSVIATGDWRTWDTNGDCFDEDEQYTAWLYAAGGGNNSTYFSVGVDAADYKIPNGFNKDYASGHFLNWFFSEDRETGGFTAAKFITDDGEARRSKLDIRRTDIMKTAAQNLISGLEGVRIGLMQFNGNHGGKLLMGLTSLTDDNSQDILDVVADVGASGNTPLAETFTGVGRYFISGYEGSELSYEASPGNAKTASASDIFSGSTNNNGNTSTIINWNGVDKPTNQVESSAVQYYCQKSFMVALTDGAPTSDNSISSHLKDYDTTCTAETCTTSQQMDDVVKALYDIDLRPDLIKPDGKPEINNITSYLIGFANQGLDDSKEMINSGKLGKGGKGKVYSADNAAELQLTFNQIFKDVRSIVGSSSAVALNSTVIESGSAVFGAKYNSGKWNGELSAWDIDTSGNLSDDPIWEASSILDSISDINTRVILTYQDNKGVPFTAAGVGTSGTDHALDLTLNSYISDAVDDGRVSDRIDYLRGDRSKEGVGEGDFRERDSRLGDIVNSTPVYVGAPDGKWSYASFPGKSAYSAFIAAHKNRTPVVYVGANDGFLHGFNASVDTVNIPDAGKELIAYSPSILLSTDDNEGLHPLTSQYYNHRFYVDGTPTVSDVYISDGASESWQTVLVGGLGAGGKGYYALNVTDPSAFTEQNAEKIVMWEFSDEDDSNLGYTYSRAQIGRMPNGEWAAIFGNGYNSATGDAGIFIVYLDGLDGPGSTTSKYAYLSTGSGSVSDINGMSTPAIIDTNLDGTVDRIYAGDLHGNLWAFDVSSSNENSWSVEKEGGTPKPLFSVAPSTNDQREAITTTPVVARNIKDETGPGLLVAFGTGQYLVDTDTADINPGGFYAVSDNGKYGLTKSNLIDRTLKEETFGGIRQRKIVGDEIDWDKTSGWYISLEAGNSLEGGERVIAQPALLGHVIFFNTMIPSGQVCAAGGSGWLMSVDLWGGLVPPEAVYDANNDGVIDKNDYGYAGEFRSNAAPNTSSYIPTGDGVLEITPDSNGDNYVRPVVALGGGRIGRLSWEEVTPF